jgi:hypothetical protein
MTGFESKRQAAQQALDLLDSGNPYHQQLAAKVLRKALEQPEQEPVAKLFGTLPVYTTPPAAQRPWQGLTEEETSNIWDDTVIATVIPFFMGFARAIEAKLKERNNGH